MLGKKNLPDCQRSRHRKSDISDSRALCHPVRHSFVHSFRCASGLVVVTLLECRGLLRSEFRSSWSRKPHRIIGETAQKEKEEEEEEE